MRIFLSSLISGMEALRAVAREAVTTLRHEPVMAEEFGARATSPQDACLEGVRKSDLVILILGPRYGTPQESGLSATHEEYREARGTKQVLAFIQQDAGTVEPKQAEFISEVERWTDGAMREVFRSADDLRTALYRGIHDFDLSKSVGPINTEALIETAKDLLGESGRRNTRNPMLSIVVQGAPLQQILRPAEIENTTLRKTLSKEALFGEIAIFDRTKGVQDEMRDAVLIFRQDHESEFSLTESGGVLIRIPVVAPTRAGISHATFPAIIEEVLQERFNSALAFASWILDFVDATRRLTHIAIVARLDGADYMAWRTQREHDASPNSGEIAMGFGKDNNSVHTTQQRAALKLNRSTISEDLVVLLRRHWKR
jgi:hypothetical protein